MNKCVILLKFIKSHPTMTEARVIINKVTKLAQEEIESESESEVVSDSLPPAWTVTY